MHDRCYRDTVVYKYTDGCLKWHWSESIHTLRTTDADPAPRSMKFTDSHAS